MFYNDCSVLPILILNTRYVIFLICYIIMFELAGHSSCPFFSFVILNCFTCLLYISSCYSPALCQYPNALNVYLLHINNFSLFSYLMSISAFCPHASCQYFLPVHLSYVIIFIFCTCVMSIFLCCPPD